MSNEQHARDQDASDDRPSTPREPQVIDVQKLLGAAREIYLDLAGERYRLRITRRGRLILSK